MKSHMVSVRLHPREYTYLARAASGNNITLSEHIRSILRKTIPPITKEEIARILKQAEHRKENVIQT